MQKDLVLDFDIFTTQSEKSIVPKTDMVVQSDVADILDGMGDIDIKDIRVASISSAEAESSYIDAGDITLDISHQIIVDDM